MYCKKQANAVLVTDAGKREALWIAIVIQTIIIYKKHSEQGVEQRRERELEINLIELNG